MNKIMSTKLSIKVHIDLKWETKSKKKKIVRGLVARPQNGPQRSFAPWLSHLCIALPTHPQDSHTLQRGWPARPREFCRSDDTSSLLRLDYKRHNGCFCLGCFLFFLTRLLRAGSQLPCQEQAYEEASEARDHTSCQQPREKAKTPSPSPNWAFRWLQPQMGDCDHPAKPSWIPDPQKSCEKCLLFCTRKFSGNLFHSNR